MDTAQPWWTPQLRFAYRLALGQWEAEVAAHGNYEMAAHRARKRKWSLRASKAESLDYALRWKLRKEAVMRKRRSWNGTSAEPCARSRRAPLPAPVIQTGKKCSCGSFATRFRLGPFDSKVWVCADCFAAKENASQELAGVESLTGKRAISYLPCNTSPLSSCTVPR
jgi:hypothetical protein